MKTTAQQKLIRIDRQSDGRYAVALAGSAAVIFRDSLSDAMALAYAITTGGVPI